MRFAQLCAAALAVAACAPDTDGLDTELRRRKDAGTSPTSPDAPATSEGGSVSCYTEGAPTNACTLPVHCCFSNYSALHNGWCTTDACTWGTIECDGPEDCASGQQCCSHRFVDA